MVGVCVVFGAGHVLAQSAVTNVAPVPGVAARLPTAKLTMSRIPEARESMGDAFDEGGVLENPVHNVQLAAFYIDKYEVSKARWDEVAIWAAANGYDINPDSAKGKQADHPAHSVSWHDCVKWCNARSQKEGLMPCYTVDGQIYKTGKIAPDCDFAASGYRLPTEAEWEMAARGGLSGKRYPRGDRITHSQANYKSDEKFNDQFNDISPTRGYHPSYATGDFPYTSPVGSFAANGYDCYDMEGNVSEWCWDWYSKYYYNDYSFYDPRGPKAGSHRVVRGGAWFLTADLCRIARRYHWEPGARKLTGFRSACSVSH